MKKIFFSILLLTLTFFAKDSHAQQAKDLSKSYAVVSVPYSVPDNDKQNFADVYFRFGWTRKAPAKIAIQFTNHGYSSRKFRFAIKDVTTNKMVLLDAVHNSRFGSETLKANSVGPIWSGLVDNIKDSFSLRVWDGDGDEFDKVAISISDQQ